LRWETKGKGCSGQRCGEGRLRAGVRVAGGGSAVGASGGRQQGQETRAVRMRVWGGGAGGAQCVMGNMVVCMARRWEVGEVRRKR